jgi:hypothetical protein
MHLFPGFSGLLVGLVLFFGLWLTACLATPAGSFTFDPQNRPGAFEPRLATSQ